MKQSTRTLLLAAITVALPFVLQAMMGGYSAMERPFFIGYTIVTPAFPFAMLTFFSVRRDREGNPRHSTRRIGTVASFALVTILVPYLVGLVSLLGGGTTPVVGGCLVGVTPLVVPLVAVLAWGLTREMEQRQPS